MRYLALPELEELSAALSNAAPSEGVRLSCRLEAYTCKAAGADKKLLVQLLRRYRAAPDAGRRTRHAGESGAESSWEDVLGAAGDSLESLVAESAPGDSPGGRRRASVDERPRAPPECELPAGMSLKALYYLVATMNLVFPDYDLVDVDPRCFVAQPDVSAVVRAVDAALGAAATPRLWELAASAVGPLDECAVYTFDAQPTRLSVLDETDDPFWERGYLYDTIEYLLRRANSQVVAELLFLQPEAEADAPRRRARCLCCGRRPRRAAVAVFPCAGGLAGPGRVTPVRC